MGFLSSLFKKKQTKPERVVRVGPCDPEGPIRFRGERPTGGYAYTWELPSEPQLGQIIYVTGSMAGKPVMVVGFGRAGYDGALEKVTRVATEKEVERLRAGEEPFFAAARRAVGLKGASRRKIRSGWPEIPPAAGDAPAALADDYGRGWWKIFKLAEDLNRDEEEVRLYQAAAYRWFSIRKRQGKSETGERGDGS